MSYDDKLSSVRALLERHNNQSVSKPLDIDKFFNCLASSGGTTEEALGACTFEDIEDCGIPRILARQIAKIFRQKDEKKVAHVKPAKAKELTNIQLLELYNPSEPDSTVAEELKRRSEGKPFIVISDGKVLVEKSADFLAELKLGHSPREMCFHENKPLVVYAVGDNPDNYAEINPLFPNEVLRPNGDCVNINRNWNSVPMSTRQLIYVARETKELVINSIKDAIEIHEKAVLDNGYDVLRSYFPKSFFKLHRMLEEGTLPSMKRKMNSSSQSLKSNDPFFSTKKVGGTAYTTGW